MYERKFIVNRPYIFIYKRLRNISVIFPVKTFKTLLVVVLLAASINIAFAAPDRKEAEREAREAEYYQREAASCRRDADYYAREAESARRDAVYYIKQGNRSRARDCQQRGERAISSYRSKIEAARRADDRVDYHLKRAADALAN